MKSEQKPSIMRAMWREEERKEKEKLKCLEREFEQIQKEKIIYNRINRIDNCIKQIR